jgi:hypothetical protein
MVIHPSVIAWKENDTTFVKYYTVMLTAETKNAKDSYFSQKFLLIVYTTEWVSAIGSILAPVE